MKDINDFSLDFFSLKNKVAVVTGGNTGLGLAFSLALAKAGAKIFIVSLEKSNKECESLLSAAGVEYDAIVIDITQADAASLIVESCKKRFSRVDILVNNAGICLVESVRSFDQNMWQKMMDINVNAAFALSKAAIEDMIPRQSGKIINICSMFSFRGCLESPAYAASKHAIAGLTKAYADELGRYNIQVNGIAPGYYATALTEATRSNPDSNARVLAHIPAGRWGERQDLMGAAVFLASSASDYVNGHILAVDGGYLVR